MVSIHSLRNLSTSRELSLTRDFAASNVVPMYTGFFLLKNILKCESQLSLSHYRHTIVKQRELKYLYAYMATYSTSYFFALFSRFTHKESTGASHGLSPSNIPSVSKLSGDFSSVSAGGGLGSSNSSTLPDRMEMKISKLIYYRYCLYSFRICQTASSILVPSHSTSQYKILCIHSRCVTCKL